MLNEEKHLLCTVTQKQLSPCFNNSLAPKYEQDHSLLTRRADNLYRDSRKACAGAVP